MDRVRTLILCLAPCLALATLDSGCSSLVCPDDCHGAPTPVKGTASMFTRSGFEGDGYRVGALTQCGTEEKRFTSVTGRGAKHAGIPLDGGCMSLPPSDAGSDCSVTLDSLLTELRSRLGQRGVTGVSTGLGTLCTGEDAVGAYAEIHDYAVADLSAEAIGEVLKNDDLADTVYLTIGPAVRFCTQMGCGW